MVWKTETAYQLMLLTVPRVILKKSVGLVLSLCSRTSYRYTRTTLLCKEAEQTVLYDFIIQSHLIKEYHHIEEVGEVVK